MFWLSHIKHCNIQNVCIDKINKIKYFSSLATSTTVILFGILLTSVWRLSNVTSFLQQSHTFTGQFPQTEIMHTYQTVFISNHKFSMWLRSGYCGTSSPSTLLPILNNPGSLCDMVHYHPGARSHCHNAIKWTERIAQFAKMSIHSI